MNEPDIVSTRTLPSGAVAETAANGVVYVRQHEKTRVRVVALTPKDIEALTE
jgi:hypothetical protein